jgi:hypothetical protein
MRAGRSARSPQYRYFLAQLVRFGFRVPKHFLFCLIWDYKTSGYLQKFCELRDQQEILNIDIPRHNWLVLGSESPNIFCSVLFGIIRLQDSYKNFEISRKSSIWIFHGTTGSFCVQSLQFFLFCLIWDYKTSRDIRKKMRTVRSAGSPQFGYFLTQLARFGFRVSKHLNYAVTADS